MPGMKAIGTNTESSTSVMAMIGAVISPIAFLVASGGESSRLLLHHALDVLDHDDRVVDDDADRQHQRQQRDGVGARSRAPACTAKVPISDTGTAMIGISVARSLPRKRKTTMRDQDEGLDQRVDDLLDGVLDEDGGVVDDVVVEILREARGSARSSVGAHRVGDLRRALAPGAW